MTPTTKDLTLVRGDSLTFGITISGLDTEPDAVTMSCKLSKRDTVCKIRKTIGDGITKLDDTEAGTYAYRIRIAPEDTEELHEGRYCYDVELRIGGDVITALMGAFDIVADVTRPGGRWQSERV